MATPEALDIAALCAPIADDAPTGVNMREDPALSTLYYQIKDARNAARTAERRSGRKRADTALQKDLDEILYHSIAPIVLKYHEQQWSWAIHAHIAKKVDNCNDDSIADAPLPSHENGHRISFWAWAIKKLR